MDSTDRVDSDVGSSGSEEKASNGVRFDERVPRVVRTGQVGPNALNGTPEQGAGRLPEVRSPRGDSQVAARFDESPQSTRGRSHVRKEKDPEHDHHGVEAFRRVVEGI